MLSLFKGELTLDDIMWKLPKKRLLELKEARKKTLIEEQKEVDRMANERRSQAIRNQIMAK